MRVKTGVQGCPESAHLRHSSLPGERQTLAGSLPDPAPAKPHLWKAGIFRRFLNSLTFCPAPAHRVPRTSSLNGPEIPHPGSRKASPHRARTPVQQGFAVALTSLTRVQGCLLLLLSSFTPRAMDKTDRPWPPPGAGSVKQCAIVWNRINSLIQQGLIGYSSFCFTEKSR